ncbi:MAG: hypothetical protein CMM58_07745 [Rhodospirillaceae bacterium]|nr:hypothetical protein [Rhodospirillaceae bacterium]|tara:strand:- start:1533 stop:2720 length:1188 start_codon:yes stop_codon:yes gene_type:complete
MFLKLGWPDSTILFWKLAVFYASYFLVFGIYMPYWPLWLDAIGLTSIEIGWILAGSFWIKVLVQPAIAHFADKRGETRILTARLMGLSALGFFFLSYAQSFWPVIILTIITAAFYQPVLPIMESVVLRCAKSNNLVYGRIRLWGSITFIVATLGGGWWLEGTSNKYIVWLLIAGMALIAISCALVPNRPKGPNPDLRFSKYKDYFLTPPFVLFLITTGLIHISHSVLYGFGTLYWRALGHSETIIGVFWSVGVLAEIVLFSIIGKYDVKFGPVMLLAIAALATTIRWPLLAIFDSALALILIQILHGFTFGAAHLGAMAFLTRSIPSEISATGQSLYYTLIGGVFSGCMLPIAGKLYTDLSGNAFYIMGLIGILALLSSMYLGKLTKRDLSNPIE